MKMLILALALLITPCLSTAYQQISGEFGQTWISNFKTQNPEAQSSNLENDLWAWGGKPHGKALQDGKLVDANFTPAMLSALNWMQAMGYSNPVIMNSSKPYGNISGPTNKALSDDPWILAQQLGRPVIASDTLYYPTI